MNLDCSCSPLHHRNCSLLADSQRCTNLAGKTTFTQRLQRTVSHRQLHLATDPSARHNFICDVHKLEIQAARTKRQPRKDSDDGESDESGGEQPQPDVDFMQLQMATLRKYKRHYKLVARPGMNKAQLADVVLRHFKGIPVNETAIVAEFLLKLRAEAERNFGK